MGALRESPIDNRQQFSGITDVPGVPGEGESLETIGPLYYNLPEPPGAGAVPASTKRNAIFAETIAVGP